jgi:hypothetical protein
MLAVLLFCYGDESAKYQNKENMGNKIDGFCGAYSHTFLKTSIKFVTF